MRLLATLPEDQARTLADYLLTLRVPAEVRPSAKGDAALWVQREEQVEAARRELAEFLQNPDDPRYHGVAGKARDLRKQAERIEKQHIKNSIPIRDRWAHRPPERCRLTMTLVGACVLVFTFLMHFGGVRSGPILDRLYIATPSQPRIAWAERDVEGAPEDIEAFAREHGMALVWTERDGAKVPVLITRTTPTGLAEVKRGQVWRLITPIFLHFNLLHILFNMMALVDIGGLIEMRKGALRLAALVLVSALVSNLAQFAWGHFQSPNFGGMSGVIYALFGYVWMKGRHEPAGGLYLSQRTTTYMLVWLVFCMTGAVGAIANAAHVAGLATGVVLGLAPHWRDELRRW